MDSPPSKRKYDGTASGPKKAAKMGGSGSGSGGGSGKMSFAQRMMAKMGYKEGQGLGKEGEGMVNPIEVKLRPQGAGVGTIKEKTSQYKEERRREAERKGEVFEDSDEEERRKRKERRKRTLGGASGTSTPGGGGGGGRKAKTKYRTIADVEAAAPGLDVPREMLNSIVDATGNETKMLTSVAGLMTPAGLPTDSEADKIARRERLELEAFIEAWHGVQEQKVYIEEHEGQHQVELDQMMDDLQRLQSVTEAIEDLRLLPPRYAVADDEEEELQPRWSVLVEKLEMIQNNHRHDIERYDLSEAAVGALTPLFKERLADWEPLQKPDKLVADLTRIRIILGLDSHHDIATTNGHAELDEAYGKSRRQKATTPYETLIYTVWLPKLRTAVTNWNILDHAPMTAVVQAWRPLLPAFVYSHLIDQLIVPKLSSGLQSWDPRKRNHHHNSKHTGVKHAQPHTWIFPWLPYLPAYQLDPKAHDSLLLDFKRKLRQILDAWDVALGLLPGLDEWRDLLRGAELDHLLMRHLLPRLALHLSTNFEIDPSDQDLTPLENILQWQNLFQPGILARLMVAEFFPKWLSTLHLWLTTPAANLEEISQWFVWWQTQLPSKISNHPAITAEWTKGTETITAALDLLDQNLPLSHHLASPAAGPAKPITKNLPRNNNKPNPPSTAAPTTPPDFKDIVEAWCAEQDLTIVPLRSAHPQTGSPLFRITASATGKGGVIVYLQGDLVWARKKHEREVFEAVGLEDLLVGRAEGR